MHLRPTITREGDKLHADTLTRATFSAVIALGMRTAGMKQKHTLNPEKAKSRRFLPPQIPSMRRAMKVDEVDWPVEVCSP